MGHVEDRWHRVVKDEEGKPVLGPSGKPVLERSDLYGKGMRYRVRYIGPNGREKSESFPDRKKREADAFLIEVESKKLSGTYIDPDAGRITFAAYADRWFDLRPVDVSTRVQTRDNLRLHVLPFFGSRPLASIGPSQIREWDAELATKLASSYRSSLFSHVNMILEAAVDDGLIGKNPCSAKSVIRPKAEQRKVVPWTLDRVLAMRAGLMPRYRAMVDVAASCGLRQGEVFGLGTHDIDTETGWLHVRRQIKWIRGRLVFGLPKSDKERRAPLPVSVGQTLGKHLANHPAVLITLPWEDPDSAELVTVPLVFTSQRHTAISRPTFDVHWRRICARVGIPKDPRNGMHALRHFYASALLDAGRSIRAVSEYLGHSNPAFTLRVYMHLMPGDDEITRDALHGLLDEAKPDDGLGTA